MVLLRVPGAFEKASFYWVMTSADSILRPPDGAAEVVS